MGSTSKALVVFATLIVIVAGLKAAEDLVVPFLLATFIATIAATPVFWLEKHRVPVAISIFAVMVTMIVVLVGIGAVVAQSAGEFTQRLQFYQANLSEQVNDVIAWLQQFGIELSGELMITFEREFLAHILLPNGHDVGETLVPQLGAAYAKGKVPKLAMFAK